MISSDNELTVLLILLLLRDAAADDDPVVYEMVYERLRNQLRQRDILDPELDIVLRRSLRHPYSRRRELQERVVSSDRRISDLSETVERVSANVKELAEAFGAQMTALDVHRREAHGYFWLMSSGADINKVAITRYIPVRLYVSDPVPEASTLRRISLGLEELLGGVGFEKADEFPEQSGSWYKRLILRSKEAVTQKEVADRLKKVERAAEIAYLDKPQAEANQCQAEAASSLLTALKETRHACAQAGSLLVIKTTVNGEEAVVVRTLTPVELKELEENQGMLHRPGEILEWLQRAGTRRLPQRQDVGPASFGTAS
jgi:hypothetical protein